MIEHEIPHGPRLALARRLFAELSEAAPAPEPDAAAAAAARIAPSRLYARAAGLTTGPDRDLDRALAGSPGLRAAYARMLEKTALYRMPELAAAHTGPENSRAGEGCEIRIEQHPAYPDQAYVIIKLTEERDSKPTTLIIRDRDNHCEDYALPEMWDNTAQMVVELESDVCRRVRRFLDDHGMRAYLR